MFAVSSWTFQNGFLEYVNQSELNRYESLSQKLAKGYAASVKVMAGKWVLVMGLFGGFCALTVFLFGAIPFVATLTIEVPEPGLALLMAIGVLALSAAGVRRLR